MDCCGCCCAGHPSQDFAPAFLLLCKLAPPPARPSKIGRRNQGGSAEKRQGACSEGPGEAYSRQRLCAEWTWRSQAKEERCWRAAELPISDNNGEMALANHSGNKGQEGSLAQEAGASLAAWIAGQKAKEAKALARQSAPAKEAKEAGAADQGPPPVKVKKSQQATELLLGMAAWGSKEGVELLLRNGADLSGKGSEGSTPVLEAIRRGHAELARWMMSLPEYEWISDRYPQGGLPSELRVAVTTSFYWPSMLDFAKEVARMRPSLWEEPLHFGEWRLRGADAKTARDDSLLILDALESSAPVAAWLIGQRPATAKMVLDAAAVDGKDYPYSGEFSTGGLVRAIHSGDEAAACAILDYSRPLIEAAWTAGRGAGSRGSTLIAQLLGRDDAAALGWIFARSPILAEQALLKTRGQGRSTSYPQGPERNGIALGALAKELGEGAQKRDRSGSERRGSLAMWAAHEKAVECLEVILGMPSFKQQLASMQSTPEFGWVDAFLIMEPKVVEQLAGAGFDFSKIAPDDWSYAAMGLCMREPTIKWLEMIGKKFSGQLGPRASDGKTPFEIAQQYLAEKSSRSRGEDRAAKVGKWASVCEKAAMRTGSSRAKSTKAAKMAKSARRL